MKVFLCLSILSLWALTACSTTISGKVSNLTGQRVFHEEARVNVVNLSKVGEERSVEVLKLDKDGSFETTIDLTQGRYLIEALVPGYRPAAARVELKTSQVVDLAVSPIKKHKTTAFNANLDVKASRGAGGASIMPPKL